MCLVFPGLPCCVKTLHLPCYSAVTFSPCSSVIAITTLTLRITIPSVVGIALDLIFPFVTTFYRAIYLLTYLVLLLPYGRCPWVCLAPLPFPLPPAGSGCQRFLPRFPPCYYYLRRLLVAVPHLTRQYLPLPTPFPPPLVGLLRALLPSWTIHLVYICGVCPFFCATFRTQLAANNVIMPLPDRYLPSHYFISLTFGSVPPFAFLHTTFYCWPCLAATTPLYYLPTLCCTCPSHLLAHLYHLTLPCIRVTVGSPTTYTTCPIGSFLLCACMPPLPAVLPHIIPYYSHLTFLPLWFYLAVYPLQ